MQKSRYETKSLNSKTYLLEKKIQSRLIFSHFYKQFLTLITLAKQCVIVQTSFFFQT